MILSTALHSSGRLKVVQVCVEIAAHSCLMRVLMAVGLIRISSAFLMMMFELRRGVIMNACNSIKPDVVLFCGDVRYNLKGVGDRYFYRTGA